MIILFIIKKPNLDFIFIGIMFGLFVVGIIIRGVGLYLKKQDYIGESPSGAYIGICFLTFIKVIVICVCLGQFCCIRSD